LELVVCHTVGLGSGAIFGFATIQAEH